MSHFRWTLPADRTAPATARHYVRQRLGALPEELVELAALLTDEVVTNAVVHGEGSPELELETDGQRVRVAVSDEASRRPRRQEAPPTSQSGRGLTILEALAHRWGVERRSRGKTVWFEVGPSI